MPLILLVILIFASAASLLFFMFYVFLYLPRRSGIKSRLESLTPPAEEMSIFLEKPPTAWQKFLGRLGANVPLRPQDYGKYQKMLVAAGIKKERITVFMGIKILLTIILPALYLIFYGIPAEKDFTTKVLMTAALFILGFLAPTFWLRHKMSNRQIEIFHDLPDLLDLMTISVEAGLSMDAAMVKVNEDEQFKKSPLAKEMKIAIRETQAGKQRLEALRDMGERTMVSDLRDFAAMLIQTEKLGTSLAQALRVFSDSLRTIRRQRAEEAAAKTAIKLLFPLVFFIFPALLLVILGPAVIRIMKLFSSI
jgi:tight adherence protein C